MVYKVNSLEVIFLESVELRIVSDREEQSGQRTQESEDVPNRQRGRGGRRGKDYMRAWKHQWKTEEFHFVLFTFPSILIPYVHQIYAYIFVPMAKNK